MSSAARPVARSASARSSTRAAWPSIHLVFSDLPRWPSGSSGVPRQSVSASSRRITAALVSPAATASRPSRAANRYRDASTSAAASVQPAPWVTMNPSPKVRRSAEMWVCRAFSAVRGGSSSHSNLINVSAGTTDPSCKPSMVRMARALAPGMVTGAPPSRTWRGPKTPSSTQGSVLMPPMVCKTVQCLVKVW